jgi:hypothetical protein
MLDLQLCAYRPDLLDLERWLRAEQFAFNGTLDVVSLAASSKYCMAELLY